MKEKYLNVNVEAHQYEAYRYITLADTGYPDVYEERTIVVCYKWLRKAGVTRNGRYRLVLKPIKKEK